MQSLLKPPARLRIKPKKEPLICIKLRKENCGSSVSKRTLSLCAKTRLIHNVSTAAANVHDITETANLLHGEECFVSADSGYRCTQKREELKGVKADWLIAKTPSRIRILKKNTLEKINSQSKRNT
jgi:IS5 family transposase